MYQELLNRNEDLKRLQNEGYEIEIKEGYIIVNNIPFLNEAKKLCHGKLISTLHLNGEIVLKPDTHVAFFSGGTPSNKDGSPIEGILNQSIDEIKANIKCNYLLSNKPDNGYDTYYDKLTRYVEIISSPAISLFKNETAKTYKKLVINESNSFVYDDTNASRSGTDNINNNLCEQNIAIIGLGGTGSYLLDYIAKTPINEIHLYDGDKFCQHNAFRAPGAPSKKTLEQVKYKTTYFKSIYSRMHKNIISHHVYLTKNNIKKLLKNINFVFINIDNGISKKIIIDFLLKEKIPFIDTGIDINKNNDCLRGTIRVTCVSDNDNKILENISFDEEDNDLYSSNIQISELNSLSAIYAIIKWKKLNNIYLDNNKKQNLVYDTNDGEIKYED